MIRRCGGLPLLALSLLMLAAACSTCPPRWSQDVPTSAAWLYAVGSSGEVFVQADAGNLALTRAARVLAAALGLDVTRRLSVVLADEHLFVEAVGAEGVVQDLDGLELVEQVQCAGRSWVLLRLPRP